MAVGEFVNSFEVGYQTGSGNKLSIIMHSFYMDRCTLPIIDNPGDFCVTEHINCGGYNGGCPPYSPRFSSVKGNITNVYVLCLEYDIANALMFANWNRGKSYPGLFIMSYADRMSMHYVQRMLSQFENMNYYTLGISNCPGCRPVECAVVRGGKCRKPAKRRFSVESTGVDCNALHKQLFGEALPWWYRTKNYIPTKMYRYALVFVDKSQSVMDDLLFDSMLADMSYCDEVPDYSGEYDSEMLVIPEGKADAGMTYLAYRVPMMEVSDD